MKQKTTPSPAEQVAEFALANLPDSIWQRKRMLRLIADSLPHCELRNRTCYMLKLLNEHEDQQPNLFASQL